MTAIFCRRLHFPVSTDALTCLCTKGRWFSITPKNYSNQNYRINPVFHNRNPRNLEKLGLTPRSKGWKYQYPVRDFYNRLDIELKKNTLTATVTHCSGKQLISVSADDEVVKWHFARPRDVEVFEIYGNILAEKMIDMGITQVCYDSSRFGENSLRHNKLMEILAEAGIELVEQDYQEPEYRAGIDYDKPNRYAERKKWKDDFQVA